MIKPRRAITGSEKEEQVGWGGGGRGTRATGKEEIVGTFGNRETALVHRDHVTTLVGANGQAVRLPCSLRRAVTWKGKVERANRHHKTGGEEQAPSKGTNKEVAPS